MENDHRFCGLHKHSQTNTHSTATITILVYIFILMGAYIDKYIHRMFGIKTIVSYYYYPGMCVCVRAFYVLL